VKSTSAKHRAEAATPVDHTDLAVGRRIRHLRKARGRSLKEVALRAGLSEGFLSQIERGISSASIRALARIADALDSGIAELFPLQEGAANDGPVRVARMDERKRIAMPRTGMSKELLTPFQMSPRLDIYIITIEPGGSTGDKPYVHQGEEAGFVLEGGIEVIVDGQKVILGVGDSFRFTSTSPHQYRNAGTTRARAVWINYKDP
jgi:transcriptional regulator with XRE-family HTH domain